MLLLTSPTDQLQIVTSAAANIGVHATWVDTNTATGVITPGRTNTVISTAATTSVAGSPAAGVQRNVKTLHIRNAHATIACNVTVQLTDGTVTPQLHKRILQSGEALQYTDQGGFTGAVVKTAGVTASRDLTLASGTQDVTGFGFNPKAVVTIWAITGATLWGVGFASGSFNTKISTGTDTPNIGHDLSRAILVSNGAGSDAQLGVISFITDGIRITWTKVGAPTGTLSMSFLGVG
jgi:hypothetical protein